MDSERSANILIGDEEYTLVLSTKATKELLTEEIVELLTVPADLATYKTAITEALYKGTKRNVQSEEDPKNAEVG